MLPADAADGWLIFISRLGNGTSPHEARRARLASVRYGSIKSQILREAPMGGSASSLLGVGVGSRRPSLALVAADAASKQRLNKDQTNRFIC